MMMGTVESLRRARATSRPSMSGRRRSRTISSGRSRATAFSANRPSPAVLQVIARELRDLRLVLHDEDGGHRAGSRPPRGAGGALSTRPACRGPWLGALAALLRGLMRPAMPFRQHRRPPCLRQSVRSRAPRPPEHRAKEAEDEHHAQQREQEAEEAEDERAGGPKRAMGTGIE